MLRKSLHSIYIYIFTPTYNRANKLVRLYKSLCNQTNKNFVWLIIDDGSTDNTENLVEGFINEDILNIKYIKKENGGKHTAYNLALDYMQENSFHVCVDSDDYLYNNAIEYFIEDISKNLINSNFIGLVYPKIPIGFRYNWLNDDVFKINIPDLHYKYNLKIETVILINNRYTQDFRFKTFNNEKFLSEGTYYIHLADKGYFYPINRELYYFEYLSDGLTNNIFNLWVKNIKGTEYSLLATYDYVNKKIKGINKFKGLITVTMNRQALLMTKYSFLKIFKKERFFNKLLMIPSFFWRKIRFRNN